jgi:hypothetical protein
VASNLVIGRAKGGETSYFMTHSFGFLVSSLLLILSRVDLVLTMSSSSTAQFPFVHPSIATVLACERAKGRPPKTFLDPQTLDFRVRCDEPSTEDLIDLAIECESILFGEGNQTTTENWDSSMRGLVAMGAQGTKDEATAATLLALNGLESAIRDSRGYITGKAPLLKTMISQMEDDNLSGISKLLLLPVPGLNLRNLLWHGFVGTLPRAWLALVLVMTRIVKDKSSSPELSPPELPAEVMPLRYNDAMQSVLAVGDEVILQERLESSSIKEWLPPSHRGLWDLAVQWIGEDTKPTCTLALLTILLEHALRIDWCRVNERPDDLLARPGTFFVTLDGHGQRHVHDLLLYPYLMTETEDEQVRNKLVDHLGGSTTALLTDLFASSCGGPNIRATVSHGLWDSFLDKELAGTAEKDSACTKGLWGMVRSVLVTMELCSGNSLSLKYRPVFSYTATTILNTKEALDSLAELATIQSTPSFLDLYSKAEEEFGDIPSDMAALDVSLSYIETQIHKLLQSEWESESSEWSADDVFVEHKLNQKLAAYGATRTLLKDISGATLLKVQSIKTAIEEWDETDSSKKRRRILRVVHLGDFAMKVYMFATLVAVTSLNNGIDGTCGSLTPATLLKAVERSRMVVSTVSTFLSSSFERALKAAREYVKGKAVKAIAGAHTTGET